MGQGCGHIRRLIISGFILRKDRSPRWHTIYSIISTIIEEAAIAALILWVLPLFDINIPLWGLLLILIAFAVFSYITYNIGHSTMSYREVNAPESIIGSEGVVESELNPEGYVRVVGELWRATSDISYVPKGTSVIITGIDGLRITVRKK